MQKERFFCEIGKTREITKSKIIRFTKKGWNGIKSNPYKASEGNWSLIERFPIISTESIKFEVRYFEISSGGSSSLEYHNHAHVVLCIKGKGKVRLGDKFKILRYLDIAYIAPKEVHQLLNPYKEPFGFICIVDRERDKPIEIKD